MVLSVKTMWWRRTNFFNIFDVTWWSGSKCMCSVKRMEKKRKKEKKEVFQVLWLFYTGPWLATNSRILLNKNKSSLILFPSGIDFKIINMQSVVFLILWTRVFPKCFFSKGWYFIQWPQPPTVIPWQLFCSGWFHKIQLWETKCTQNLRRCSLRLLCK